MNAGQVDAPVEGDDNQEPDPHNNILENRLPVSLQNHPAVRAFVSSKSSFIVTDPRSPGNPIIYASSAFLYLTGYSIDRVLGRNCRFLQGPETEPSAVASIREAVDNGRDIAITLLNYRSDGTTFWNNVIIAGVREDVNGEKCLCYFIGLQIPTSRPIAEPDVPTQGSTSE
jgi:PAS domain S-box-containing protein